MNVALEAGTAIYVAMAVALAVWIGIFVYLWRIDAQARELRRRLDSEPKRQVAAAPSARLRDQRTQNTDQRTENRTSEPVQR